MAGIAAISGQLTHAIGQLSDTASRATAADNTFGEMVAALTNSVAAPLRKAEETALAGIDGKASVQNVVETVMEAERSLQTAIAVRDKIVSAYLELTRMQI